MFAAMIGHHPLAAFFIMLLVIPVFLVIAVAIFTTLVILPVAWGMGWL